MSGVVYRSVAAGQAVEKQYRRVLDQWPVGKRELQLPTCAGSTFVLASGAQGAPPVVLLHGAQANSAAWMLDAAAWSTQFRLYAVDMIGEAGFSAQVRPALDAETHAQWLDDVFEGLGLTRAAIVGTSLGGWLALDYARRRPEKVSSLALICPAGIGRQKNFLLKAAPLLLLGAWGARRMRRMVFGPTAETPPPAAAPLAQLMEAVGKAIKPRVVAIPALSDAELSGLDMPILAIVGGRDVLLDSHDTRARLQQFAPQAEICFIEDGYHFLPNQTARVMDFLERCVRGA